MYLGMYLINPHSPDSKWRTTSIPANLHLEFVIVYPLFTIIVLSYYSREPYISMRPRDTFDYVGLLDEFYTIKIISNISGMCVNNLDTIYPKNLDTFLQAAIRGYKAQGEKCSSEELLNIFLGIKDKVPWLCSLCMSN